MVYILSVAVQPALNYSDTRCIVKQEMLNPKTGEFELLTSKEWWCIKLGLNKDASIDNTTLELLKGPEFAIGFAFNCYELDSPGANAWLVDLYKDWFPRTPNTSVFLQWVAFTKDHYDLERRLPDIEKLYALQKKIMEASVSSLKLKIKYIDKKSKLEMKQYKGKWK